MAMIRMRKTSKAGSLPLRYAELAVVTTAVLLVGVMTGCVPSAQDRRTETARPSSEKLELLDLEGRTVDPLKNSDALATVFLFARVDCPVSNRYAPEVQRLYKQFQPHKVDFCLVYPDPDQTADRIRQHMKEYGYPFRALRDPQHQLVAKTGAKITPEAAILLSNGNVAYCGRIDDWYADFGKARAAPTRRDLEVALKAVVSGRTAPPPSGDPVGCFISDLKP